MHVCLKRIRMEKMKSLHPFTKNSHTQNLQISADFFQISSTQTLVTFELEGAVDAVYWPPSDDTSTRQDELWKHTCFECFWAETPSPEAAYTEINCSPNGNWNAYSFQSYRNGMSADNKLEVQLKHWESDRERVNFQIQITSTQDLNMTVVGLTAVIELVNGEKTYWSLAHPGPQPDFHRKDGWISLIDAPRE